MQTTLREPFNLSQDGGVQPSDPRPLYRLKDVLQVTGFDQFFAEKGQATEAEYAEHLLMELEPFCFQDIMGVRVRPVRVDVYAYYGYSHAEIMGRDIDSQLNRALYRIGDVNEFGIFQLHIGWIKLSGLDDAYPAVPDRDKIVAALKKLGLITCPNGRPHAGQFTTRHAQGGLAILAPEALANPDLLEQMQAALLKIGYTSRVRHSDACGLEYSPKGFSGDILLVEYQIVNRKCRDVKR